MEFGNLLEEVDQSVNQFLRDATEVSATELGLDQRAFWGEAKVTLEVIAVNKAQDRTLQYYGGFEYVNKEDRYVMGDWVFYHVEDDRVREALANVFEDLRGEDDEVWCYPG